MTARVRVWSRAIGQAISKEEALPIEPISSPTTVQADELRLRLTAPHEEAPGWLVELWTLDGETLLEAAQGDDIDDAALGAAFEMRRMLGGEEESNLEEPHKDDLG